MATKTVAPSKSKPVAKKATTVELPTVRADTTTTEWAAALLKTIGAPVTANNENNLKLWMASEEPSSQWLSRNNPLNTTYGRSGSGIPSYKTITDGIAATADTLNMPAYTGIVEALKKNAPTKVFKAAVVQSPWDAGHYSSAGTLDGKNFATTPLNAYATSTGSTPTSIIGGILNHVPLDVFTVPTGLEPVPLGVSTGAAVTVVNHDADSTVDAVGNSLSGLAKLESELTSATFWKRIGVGALGVGLVITGIVIFVATSKTGEKTIGGAEKAGMLAA